MKQKGQGLIEYGILLLFCFFVGWTFVQILGCSSGGC